MLCFPCSPSQTYFQVYSQLYPFLSVIHFSLFFVKFLTLLHLVCRQLRDLRKDNSRLETDLEDKDKVPG